MKLPLVLAVLIGTALLVAGIGCSTTPPSEVAPTLNIDATAEARVKQEVAAQPKGIPAGTPFSKATDTSIRLSNYYTQLERPLALLDQSKKEWDELSEIVAEQMSATTYFKDWQRIASQSIPTYDTLVENIRQVENGLSTIVPPKTSSDDHYMLYELVQEFRGVLLVERRAMSAIATGSSDFRTAVSDARVAVDKFNRTRAKIMADILR